MLPIGVIGCGDEWEAVWAPALAGQSRLKLAALYDNIAHRGERIGEDLDLAPAANARALLATRALRGLIVVDSGWLQSWVIQQANALRMPVLVSPRGVSLQALADTFPTSNTDALVQPELRRRYTAATMRLRELTATRLGPVQRLTVEICSPDPLTIEQVAEAIDWCRFVVQSAVVEVHQQPVGRGIRVVFRKQLDGIPVEAEVLQRDTAGDDVPAYPADFSAELACRDGVAFVIGNRRVRWKAADETADEELAEDRSSVAVQLDLFSRRLVGGLVPVASLEDVATAIELARSVIS